MLMLNQPVRLNDTSKILYIRAFDTATGKPKTGLTYLTSNLVIYSSLNGAAPASIGTLSTMTEGTWTSLGFKECANVPGLYQVGIPNAKLSSAVGNIVLSGRITSDDTVFFRDESIAISGANLYATKTDANVTQFGGTDIATTELTAVPAANSSLDKMIRWLFLLARNKITQTATTQTVYADDGTTTVATSTVSDNGTTATRGELG